MGSTASLLDPPRVLPPGAGVPGPSRSRCPATPLTRALTSAAAAAAASMCSRAWRAGLAGGARAGPAINSARASRGAVTGGRWAGHGGLPHLLPKYSCGPLPGGSHTKEPATGGSRLGGKGSSRAGRRKGKPRPFLRPVLRAGSCAPPLGLQHEAQLQGLCHEVLPVPPPVLASPSEDSCPPPVFGRGD